MNEIEQLRRTLADAMGFIPANDTIVGDLPAVQNVKRRARSLLGKWEDMVTPGLHEQIGDSKWNE